MERVFSLCALLLLANLDTALLGMHWALAHRRVGRGQELMLAGTTSLFTMLSLLLGNAAGAAIGQWASTASGLLLIGMGFWSVLDWLRPVEETTSPPPTGLGQTFFLALTLGLNNCGVGVGAGLNGQPPLLAGALNFLFTSLLLHLGGALGERARGTGWERQLSLAGGVALILLGALAAQG